MFRNHLKLSHSLISVGGEYWQLILEVDSGSELSKRVPAHIKDEEKPFVKSDLMCCPRDMLFSNCMYSCVASTVTRGYL